MKNKRFAYTLILMVLMSVLSFNPSFAQWGSAVLEGIVTGTTNDVTTISSLGLDDAGTLHVLFQRTVSAGNVDYYYKHKHYGGIWSGEVPVASTGQLNDGQLAANKATGEAYIVFLQDGVLQLAIGTDSTFIIYPINITGVNNLFDPAIAIDVEGRAHGAVVAEIPGGQYYIAYGCYDPGIGLLFYQVLTQTNLGAFGSGASPDIAVLSNGAVVITYRGVTTGVYQIDIIENSTFGGTVWNLQTMVTPSYYCYSSSLEATESDVVHMAYSGDLGWGMPASVFYTYRTIPNIWSVYQSVSGTISGVNSKMAVEEDGTAHIVFEKRSGNILTGDIYYSGNSTGMWQVQLLQSGEDYEPSIAVDELGNCSMVFYHSVAYQNGDVYYYGYVGGEIPQLQVELTPIGAPIQIPPGGGSFHYDISITNIDTFTGAFDAWIDAVLPNGSIYGPIILRNNLSLAPGQTIIRTNLTQNVPASAPAGEYYYRASAGDYPATIVASDSFSFDKLAGEDGSYSVGGWELYGWEGEAQSELSMPMDYMMLSAFPNPFNSTTTLQIELPQRSNVKLELYNINGQLIRVIYSGMQNAGSPKFRFDASDLASGVYFCKMKAESLESSKKFSEVNKLILLK